MDEECQPNAIVRVKLNQLKKDFFDYIEKNSDKIDANVPVFYGQVVDTLEKTLPNVNDDLYDHFIDSITLRVLEKSTKSKDISYVEKLFDYAERNKRRKTGKALFDIVLGIKLINLGKYAEAIEQLKKYRNVDVLICPAIAYCYFARSPQPGGDRDQEEPARGPTPSALAAREQMIELVRLNPPMNRLKEMGIGDDPGYQQDLLVHVKTGDCMVPRRTGIFKDRNREGVKVMGSVISGRNFWEWQLSGSLMICTSSGSSTSSSSRNVMQGVWRE